MALPAITVLTGNNPHQRRYVFGYCINNCRYQLGVSPDWLSLALHLKRVALLLLIGEQRDGRVEISAVGSSDSNFCRCRNSVVYAPCPISRVQPLLPKMHDAIRLAANSVRQLLP
jgi:hypothetical protein